MQPQAPTDACPDDEILRAFMLGDLSEAAIDAVRRHQEVCAVCEARAQRFDGDTDAILDELRLSVVLGASEARGHGRELAVGHGPPHLPDYEIDETPIGVGSTGLIYRARHIKLGRVVALKMIARRPDVVSRLFEMEAKAVAQLQHPNIVQIYDIGRDGDNPFLALEFVDGGSLDRRIEAGPMEPRAAAELVRSLAMAVDHAHRHGIVHCDLKPANILTTREGVPKIADFGVAKWIESDGYWGEEGASRGTPRYMAPEQAGAAGVVGPTTDVYSLGVILYELISGKVPHPAETAAETLKLIRDEPPMGPGTIRRGIPRDLDVIALKCLRKLPEHRYVDARALADDLGRFLAGRPITARPVGAVERVLRNVKVRPLLAASLLALGTLAWIFDWRKSSDIQHPDPVAKVEDRALQTQSFDERSRTEFQDDGSIRLGAAAATLTGESLRFEHSFGNIGYWHGHEDVATWRFRIEEEGEYELSLEYANRHGDEGNRYEVRVDERTYIGTAMGTKGWSDYRLFAVARVRLSTGGHILEVRPHEPLHEALFDLRSIVLVPVEAQSRQDAEAANSGVGSGATGRSAYRPRGSRESQNQ